MSELYAPGMQVMSKEGCAFVLVERLQSERLSMKLEDGYWGCAHVPRFRPEHPWDISLHEHHFIGGGTPIAPHQQGCRFSPKAEDDELERP